MAGSGYLVLLMLLGACGVAPGKCGWVVAGSLQARTCAHQAQLVRCGKGGRSRRGNPIPDCLAPTRPALVGSSWLSWLLATHSFWMGSDSTQAGRCGDSSVFCRGGSVGGAQAALRSSDGVARMQEHVAGCSLPCQQAFIHTYFSAACPASRALPHRQLQVGHCGEGADRRRHAGQLARVNRLREGRDESTVATSWGAGAQPPFDACPPGRCWPLHGGHAPCRAPTNPA